MIIKSALVLSLQINSNDIDLEKTLIAQEQNRFRHAVEAKQEMDPEIEFLFKKLFESIEKDQKPPFNLNNLKKN